MSKCGMTTWTPNRSAPSNVYTRRWICPDMRAAGPKFEAYLASVKSFEKNRFEYSDEAAAKVEKRLSRYLEKWDYRRPGA